MFNFNLFNLAEFNSIAVGEIAIPQDGIVYGGFSLQNANMTVSKVSYDIGHMVESNTYNNPLTDLGRQTSYFFREKIILIEGTMKSENRETMEMDIDSLKRALGRPDRDLDIKVNGNIRRAKASCVNLDSLFDRKHFHINFIPFSIQFRIVSEFAKELKREIQTFSNLTGNITEEIINTGSAKSNPTVTLIFTDANTTNLITFAIADNTISIGETIVDNDVIVIDCENKKVTKNNIEIDFSGTFPILDVMTNSYTITANGTVDYNLNISYFNNFL